MEHTTGSFTLPGEAGYEDLTLQMAKKWGADVIRDSDGTHLSDAITKAGYGIYSTICIIRADLDWARANMDKLQQNFLMSEPVTAESDTVTIDLLSGFFRQQFIINKTDNPKEFWQVFDRTSGEEVPCDQWTFDPEAETVTATGITPWHIYTVNFLAVRIWEEISMYNHITNNWGDRPHLMAVDPRYPETQKHMLDWLDNWCRQNPDTTVVRFTSMFYNFAWFWSDDPKNRDVFSDWGSYAMTTTPLALREFAKEKGWKMTSEDFVNAGEYTSTHNVPSERYLAWMDFINRFVVSFGRKLVDLVHSYGKKAYVFYDDSWIGVEPYGRRFPEFGFDGLIKCVFNGFEARLCAGADVKVHELRFHPYLFPTGLVGEPTFAPGGNPTLEASQYWVNVRRALLREPVDRIGLGGYLHLVQDFPDFCDYMAKVADEFRMLKKFNQSCRPYTIPGKVVVLHSWGKLRSWICSGHLHEHPEVDLTNINESMSGLPIHVEFISFDDLVRDGLPEGTSVVINAGAAGSAWSGGRHWEDPEVIARLTAFVAQGGGLIGVNEPSAVSRNGRFFQMAEVFGVDRDLATKKCLRKYHFTVEKNSWILQDTPDLPASMKEVDGVYLKAPDVKVLAAAADGTPLVTARAFGKGRALYLSSFRTGLEASRMLLRAILWASHNEGGMDRYICSNYRTECAYYGDIAKLVVINDTGDPQDTEITTDSGKVSVHLKPFETVIQ